MPNAELHREQQELLAEASVKAYWDYSAMSLHKREGKPQPPRTEAVDRLAGVEHEMLRRVSAPANRTPPTDLSLAP